MAIAMATSPMTDGVKVNEAAVIVGPKVTVAGENVPAPTNSNVTEAEGRKSECTRRGGDVTPT
jgi:hypothetical protein